MIYYYWEQNQLHVKPEYTGHHSDWHSLIIILFISPEWGKDISNTMFLYGYRRGQDRLWLAVPPATRCRLYYRVHVKYNPWGEDISNNTFLHSYMCTIAVKTDNDSLYLQQSRCRLHYRVAYKRQPWTAMISPTTLKSQSPTAPEEKWARNTTTTSTSTVTPVIKSLIITISLKQTDIISMKPPRISITFQMPSLVENGTWLPSQIWGSISLRHLFLFWQKKKDLRRRYARNMRSIKM